MTLVAKIFVVMMPVMVLVIGKLPAKFSQQLILEASNLHLL